MDQANTAIDPEDFRQGMQSLASGVTIVATGTLAERNGFTATAVMSLSDSPPSLVVGVGRRNRAHDPLVRTGRFSVNVLHGDQDRIADAFCGRLGLNGDERFSVGDWVQGVTDCPCLADALVSFECVLVERIVTDTHTVAVGHVVHITRRSASQPLVYWRRDYNGVIRLPSAASA